MRNQSQLEVRRSMVSMQIGQAIQFSIDGENASEVDAYAKSFAKNIKINVETVVSKSGVLVSRIPIPEKTSIYPELDALEIGASHLFKIPATMHQRIRQAATFRNKFGSVRLSCIAESDGIRVTRVPMNNDEAATCEPITVAVRVTKYDLNRLSDTRELSFTIAPAEQHKLRLAASTKARTTGWRIRCRIQDDGTMLVYRTDFVAPAQQESATA